MPRLLWRQLICRVAGAHHTVVRLRHGAGLAMHSEVGSGRRSLARELGKRSVRSRSSKGNAMQEADILNSGRVQLWFGAVGVDGRHLDGTCDQGDVDHGWR